MHNFLFASIFCVTVLCFTMAAGVQPLHAGGKLFINERVSINKDDLWEAGETAGITYGVLNRSKAGELGVPPGFMLFDQQGKLVNMLKSADDHLQGLDFDTCGGVLPSPDGRILAIDNGTWLVRGLSFFSFPELRETARPVSYMSMADKLENDIFWLDNNTVGFTAINDDKAVRDCGIDYDPHGIRSVMFYNVATGEKSCPLAGDSLCDYILKGFDGKNILAEKICAAGVEQWKNPNLFDAFEKTEVSVPYQP